MKGESCLFEKVVGNADTKARLTHLIEQRAVSHAYLLEGRAGSGRHTLIYELLAALAKDEPAEVTDKIPMGLSPDVHILSPEKDSVYISVKQIRSLLEDLLVIPNELPFHAVIIQPADAMNLNAQNALLKQLEEPRSQILFFLLTENASMLLPTIRSRVQQIRMEHLSRELLTEYLKKESSKARMLMQMEPERFDALLRQADGRLGTALSLLEKRDSKNAVPYDYDAIASLFQLFAERKTAELYVRICSLGTKRDALRASFSALYAGFRDLLLRKRKAEGELLFFRDTTIPDSLVSKLTARQLMRGYTAVQTAISDCGANGNTTLLLTALANTLCHTK